MCTDIAPPPRWPKVIGIISISLGSLSILCGFGGGIAMLFLASMFSQFAQAAPATLGAPNIPVAPPEVFINAPSIIRLALEPVINGLLIAAGIFLLRRRALGQRLHAAYFFVALPYAAIYLWATWVTSTAQIEWFRAEAAVTEDQQMANLLRQQASINESILPATLAFTVAFPLAYPVFCAIWFFVTKANTPIDASADSNGSGSSADAC